jgi:hypothetical protein
VLNADEDDDDENADDTDLAGSPAARIFKDCYAVIDFNPYFKYYKK